MIKKIIIPFFLFSNAVLAQYAPAAGEPGTTAISRDSSAFVAWATGSIIERGLQDISNASLGAANVGNGSAVIGMAGTTGVVSLGDGGNAVISFLHPIVNGPSWDFAVFENSFDDAFLELAFVEVSSDGINFYRFPASSLTDTSAQTESFGATDPAKINNLAGKYRALYGTPFDLDELSGVAGLDVNNIQYVKVVDVVGSINPQYASYDTAGRAVNDPWPTGFGSGGFDLDAVGVIHHDAFAGITELSAENGFDVYPNPCSASDNLSIRFKDEKTKVKRMTVYSVQGAKILESTSQETTISALSKGIYMLEVVSDNNTVYRKKLIIKE